MDYKNMKKECKCVKSHQWTDGEAICFCPCHSEKPVEKCEVQESGEENPSPLNGGKPDKSTSLKSKNIVVCAVHGNKAYGIAPTHYCKWKIGEGCNCKCTCPQPEKKQEWEEIEKKYKVLKAEDFLPETYVITFPQLKKLLSEKEAEIEELKEWKHVLLARMSDILKLLKP